MTCPLATGMPEKLEGSSIKERSVTWKDKNSTLWYHMYIYINIVWSPSNSLYVYVFYTHILYMYTLGKLTWNTKKWWFGRGCSFSIGWNFRFHDDTFIFVPIFNCLHPFSYPQEWLWTPGQHLKLDRRSSSETDQSKQRWWKLEAYEKKNHWFPFIRPKIRTLLYICIYFWGENKLLIIPKPDQLVQWNISNTTIRYNLWRMAIKEKKTCCVEKAVHWT